MTDTQETSTTNKMTTSASASASTYRYEFSKPFCEILEQFARLHKYDDRKVFKEAWTEWSEENGEWIERECIALRESGYEGDSLDKMFKSARYYFRKKGVVEKEKAPRKTYTKVDAELLKEMDAYIKEHMEMKPHDCYVTFCEKFREELIVYMGELGEEKMKKTFKNRRSIMQKSCEKGAREQEQLV
jgi:hypothetical protein